MFLVRAMEINQLTSDICVVTFTKFYLVYWLLAKLLAGGIKHLICVTLFIKLKQK